LVKGIVFAVFLTVFAAAQVKAPERRVENNVIVSEHDPKVRIELPKSAQYVGADR